MKTIYTVHAIGFEVSDEISERVRFVEHEALEDIKHKLAIENDITFISLGGVKNEQGEENSHVAHDLLKDHKDKIPNGSHILTLGGESFIEQCLEVVKYTNSALPKEKIRLVTGVEDSPMQPFHLKLAYKAAFVLYPAVDFAKKHNTVYRIFAPLIAFGCIFMPFLAGKLEVGYYDYSFIKKAGVFKELRLIFSLLWNPLKSVLVSDEEIMKTEEGEKKEDVSEKNKQEPQEVAQVS